MKQDTQPIRQFFPALIFFLPAIVCAELLPYEEEKDRFSFAQTYLSIDYGRYSLTSPLPEGETHDSSIFIPGMTIGGLHFWGMADLYVAFPFPGEKEADKLKYEFSPGIETGFKYYPVAIRDKSIRGFVGAGFAFPSYQQAYQQETTGGPSRNGATSQKLVGTGLIGASYTTSPFIFDVGIKYTPDSDFRYYITPEEKGRVEYDDYSLFVSAKWFTDTTARRKTAHQRSPAEELDLPRGLYPYVGIGPSAAWLVHDSSFVDDSHPHLSIEESPIVFPEFSTGIIWKRINRKGWRTIFNISYRPQKLETEGFGITHRYTNNSLAFEVFQSFWDYHGFVPFAGISHARNRLEFRQTGGNPIKARSDVTGIVFGWDILPLHKLSWYLRTTLRYYPEVLIETDAGNIQYPDFEFNFIQYVRQF